MWEWGNKKYRVDLMRRISTGELMTMMRKNLVVRRWDVICNDDES